MRQGRRHLIVAFALILAVSVATPAIGALPANLVSKALKIAKGANKRSKQALAAAKRAHRA